jgi:hypothetical protein
MLRKLATLVLVVGTVTVALAQALPYARRATGRAADTARR